MIDIHSNSFVSDPYPVYRQLRELDEPYWLPHKQLNSTSPGMWLFSRYPDVVEILKSSVTISKQITRVRTSGAATLSTDLNMLNQDPPEHTRLRELVAYMFTPARIKEMEPRIEQIVDKLITNICAKKEADFITDLAKPLPVIVVAELIGIPQEDHDLFSRWSSDMLLGYDSVVANKEMFSKQEKALKELTDYFNRLIEKYRRKPDESLISTLVKAHDEQKKLTAGEIVAMCMLFLVAGHETTFNLIGTGMLSLLRNPEQFSLLKKHPEYLSSTIEEMLRFESPAQRATFRITAQDCKIAGKQFRKGEQICAIIGSANRDPSQFGNPDDFDIRRNPNRHLAFGQGVHFCLGAVLARTEARISFSRILERMPDIRMLPQTLVWNKATMFRGLQNLPIAI